MVSRFGWKAWWYERFQDSSLSTLRVALAPIGTMAACLALDQIQAVIPLLLSVIAETDDNWHGRLRAQLTTLLFFALIIWTVQLRLPHRAFLMLVFVAVAFFLTLLGALGERYRAMESATLIMTVYATLATQPPASRALV